MRNPTQIYQQLDWTSSDIQNTEMRFSVGTLMLACILIAVVVAMFKLSSESSALRKENRTLRVKLERVDVADRRRCYVRAVDSDDEWTWRYNVYLPGGTFVAGTSLGHTGVPFESPGHFSALLSIDKDESLIKMSIDPGGIVLRSPIRAERKEMLDDYDSLVVPEGQIDRRGSEMIPLLMRSDGSGYAFLVSFKRHINHGAGRIVNAGPVDGDSPSGLTPQNP